MLINAKAPLEFQKDALYSFYYTRNRYFKLLINITPYELQYRVKPNISRLRIQFSQATFYRPKEQNVNKLLLTSIRTIFIGYSSSRYVIFNLVTKRTQESVYIVVYKNLRSRDLIRQIQGYTHFPNSSIKVIQPQIQS